MINTYKIIFIFIIIAGTLISISSSSWIGIWVGLEVNLLSIIPLISRKNALNTETSIKYFIVQALASSVIIITFLFMTIKSNNEILSLMINSALLMKMGAAPFHFWFPEIIDGLRWFNTILILTWQKIAPIIVISYKMMPNFIIIAIIISMIIRGILGINQTSIRKILAYRSINHMGWILAAIIFMDTTWTLYFAVYAITSIIIIAFFMESNVFHLKQIFILSRQNFILKTLFIMNFLSFGGLPPFIGFFAKWITIQMMIQNEIYLIMLIIIIITIIPLYFYVRLIIRTLLVRSQEINFKTEYPFNQQILSLINTVSIIRLIFLTMLYNFI